VTETIKFDVDADGIALLAIDIPGVTMNVVTPGFQRDLNDLIDRIAGDAAIKGAVLTSAKPTAFMAGFDLKSIGHIFAHDRSQAERFDDAFSLNRMFRKLETCGKPFAVAINGLAMGAGLELSLACHYRVCLDDPRLQLALPEVKVGLLPGAGGTQRLVRLTGVMAALPYLLKGNSMSPQEALALKVVNEVVPADRLIDAAKAWIKANPKAVQPWDVKGFKVPGGVGQFNANFFQTMVAGTALIQKETLGVYNAPKAIISAVYEGSQLPMDKAIRVESKYFVKLVSDPQAVSMVRTLFVSKQAAERGARRPAEVPPAPTARLAILGAGMMGAGIAHVAAAAGIDVVLLDRDQASADKGRAYSVTLVEKAVKRGKMKQDKADALLARIRPTAAIADVAGCDLVIEAVFEDRAVKAEITKKVEAVLGADVIFGSNTSTLPITGLAEAWSRPENFIGIHFFSPVDKMPLVEIIKGQKTGAAAIAKALDFVRQIRKTPIVVNDSRGFYTSRCFGTYVMEGYGLLGEGVTPALIENCGQQIGMPVGPLAVGDEVAIDLSYRVLQQTRKDLGDAYQPSPGDPVLERMHALGRFGRKTAKGFYVYPEDGGRKYLWPELGSEFPRLPEAQQPAPDAVKDRLFWRQVVECARCFAEGVLDTPEDGDVGAIFGWGMAPQTGGPFSAMDAIGLTAVVQKLDALAAAHGPRFAPPQLLRDMAARGETFYGATARKQAA